MASKAHINHLDYMPDNNMDNSIAWTIGGSDSSGGAGIQADTITFNNLGAHGCSIITAITAQNTLGVNSIEAVSPTILRAQIDTLLADLPPKAIKTGMLYSIANVKLVAKLFSDIDTFKICDPVMVATSGSSLLKNENIVQTLIDHLLPHTDLLTPNIPEAETLLKLDLSSPKTHNTSYIKELANKLLALGPKAILLKGGHSNGPLSNDYFVDKNHSVWLSNKRISTKSTHGTGCTLSAAIAAAVSLGYSLLDAIVIAKAYVHQGLRLSKQIGQGHGPIAHGQWPENSADLPNLIPDSSVDLLSTWLNNPSFPDCGEDVLGVYPVVNSSAWLEKLLPAGITTAQLRIKSDHANEKYIEEEIIKAIEIGKRYSCRLFINDYWQLAIKYGAYGVHLGQEDLDTADFNALINSGMRLGISTHCYAEVARALAYKPSYIAVGPIYDTTTKVMPWIPQGLENLKRWRRSLDYPIVAIAGITLERLPDVVAAGANGVAVIRDILNNKDP
ncbi:MAG: bifunctional hydroxymethylpyrimidine kinase/phosphomethylpyrimidine kinase, partial [Methylophilus sp.]